MEGDNLLNAETLAHQRILPVIAIDVVEFLSPSPWFFPFRVIHISSRCLRLFSLIWLNPSPIFWCMDWFLKNYPLHHVMSNEKIMQVLLFLMFCTFSEYDNYSSGSLLKDRGSPTMTVRSSTYIESQPTSGPQPDGYPSQSTTQSGSCPDGYPDNIAPQSGYLPLRGKFCRYHCGIDTTWEHTPNHSK